MTVIVIAMVVSGFASQYSPGVMEEVAWNRTCADEPYCMDVPKFPVYDMQHIAHWDCSRAGSIVALRYPGMQWQSAQIIDCPRPGDGTLEWMTRNNILIEMDYRQAERLGIVGRLDQRVEIKKYVPVPVWDIPDGGPYLTL